MDVRYDQELVKCVLIGDPATGKSRLACARAYGYRYSKQQLLIKHIPTVFAIDEYRNNPVVRERSNCAVDGVFVKLLVWDTFGDHDKNRRYAYENADAVILCYSVYDLQSYNHCRSKWKCEIRRYCPNVPVVLVATQVDLRYAEPDELKKVNIRGHLSRNADDILLPEHGRQLAKDIKASKYYETSMVNNYGVDMVFENAIRLVLIQRSKLRFWSSQLRQVLRPLAQKPYLPTKRRLPTVAVERSQYWSDLRSALHKLDYTDVKFIIEGCTVHSHKIILCAAWPKFCDLIKSMSEGKDCDPSLDDFMFGLKFLYLELYDQHELSNRKKLSIGRAVFQVHQRISLAVFEKIVNYLYSFEIEAHENGGLLEDLRLASQMLCLDELQVILANVADGKAYKNVSLINDAQEKFIGRIKMLCISDDFRAGFGAGFVPDATFEVDDMIVPINRIIVTSRCDVIAAMFNGSFLESGEQHARFPDVCQDTLISFLEYLYTDSCLIKSEYALELLILANRFCLPILVSICENFLAHELREIDNDDCQRSWLINKNVILLLNLADMHNAPNLKACCTAYISNNYLEMQRQHSKLLQDTIDCFTMKNIQDNRWPPSWYTDELQMYEKETDKVEQDQKNRKSKQILRLLNALIN